MPGKTVIYHKKEHIARITLNRAASGNRLNEAMAGELVDICYRINREDDVYVVILTGAGDVFCAGGEPDGLPYLPAQAIAEIDRPVIAAINGDALGEGLELALSCDIRIAADKARFGLPQITGGMIPGDGGTQRLPRIVGQGKALELLFTGEAVNAAEALATGLVSRVVSGSALMSAAETLAQAVAGKAPVALRYAKEAVHKGMDLTLEQGNRLEADLYLLLHTTADRTEGIKAFLEKRQPRFRGE